MGDNLNCFSQVFAFSFFVENVPVYLAGCKIGVFIKVFINESFIVSKVKVSFGAIFSYKNLSVLIRTHCAGIHINIWIKLLRRDL